MWSDIFRKLSHIFNLLDNISIAIVLESTYEIEKDIRGDNYMRIKLLDLFISDVIERIKPYLEVKNVKISGLVDALHLMFFCRKRMYAKRLLNLQKHL